MHTHTQNQKVSGIPNKNLKKRIKKEIKNGKRKEIMESESGKNHNPPQVSFLFPLSFASSPAAPCHWQAATSAQSSCPRLAGLPPTPDG